MPYLQLDLPGRFPAAVKRALAVRLCELYASVMETQRWRPNVGIRELGEDNLLHLGPDGPEAMTLVMCDIRRGRSAAQRLALAEGIVAACADLLGVEQRGVLIEFTQHDGDEMYRAGGWVADWDAAETAASPAR